MTALRKIAEDIALAAASLERAARALRIIADATCPDCGGKGASWYGVARGWKQCEGVVCRAKRAAEE